MDEDLVADRLAQLRTKTKQLRSRRDELALAFDDEPTIPEPATIARVADHIAEIITSGTHNQTKALIEALIERVTITARNRLVPVFRIPRNGDGAATATPAETTPNTPVRTMTNPVELRGLEPLTPTLPEPRRIADQRVQRSFNAVVLVLPVPAVVDVVVRTVVSRSTNGCPTSNLPGSRVDDLWPVQTALAGNGRCCQTTDELRRERGPASAGCLPNAAFVWPALSRSRYAE
jgi:hypothetical protein